MTKTVVVVNVLHWSVSILKKRQIIFKGEGGGQNISFSGILVRGGTYYASTK